MALTMDQLDHEFIGRGDSNVESIRLQEMYEQNLTPEELNRMKQIAPFVEEFFVLDYKGKTGEFPKTDRQTPIDQVPEDQQMNVEDYARTRGIDEGHIEEVMTELGGSRESIITDRNSPLPTPSNNTNNTISPQVAAKEQPSVRTEERQQLRTGVDDLEEISKVRTQGNPAVQEVIPSAQSGIVQDLEDPAASPVGDTVPMDNVEEGSAVINAAAVKIVGLKDLLKAREEAREILRSQGKTVDEGKSYKGDGVDVALSNGEFIFTKQEAEVIGQETIDKWNKKGQEDTEKAIVQEQGQPVQNPNQVGVQPIMGAREGKIIPDLPPEKPYSIKHMGAFPAESPRKNMETYYTDNRTVPTGDDQGKDALFNLARNMPLGMDRETWLATMATFGEAGGDPDSMDAITNVIRNRKEIAAGGGKGTELWKTGLEEQINNDEWNALSPKDFDEISGKGYRDIMIKGRNRREEFIKADRESLYKKVNTILNNPTRDDPTDGRTFYIKRDRVDDNLVPLNKKGKGQQYFVKEFNKGNLFDPMQIGDHIFYRYKH